MSRRGWDVFVYRTDLEKEKFSGSFFDEAEAEKWIAGRKEGTYEVSKEKPSQRITPSVGDGSTEQAEEAPDD